MRNHSIDTLKFVCAALVVFAHASVQWRSDYLVIARCAVPCFFIISGYFLVGENMRERMWKGCSKMIWIILYSTLLFTAVSLIVHHFDYNYIIPSGKDIFNFILFNDNPWGFHLWYLNAYLYVLIICIFIDRYNKWHIAYMAVPILLVGDLLFGKYSLLILHHQYPYIFVRNFMFVGVPYFLIGTYIRKHNLSVTNHKEVVFGGVIFMLFISFLENRLLVQLGLNAQRDHYISTTPLAILLFIWFLSRHQTSPTILSEKGNKDSLWIYILHPLWIIIFRKLNPHLPDYWTHMYIYTAPLLILGCTLMLIFVLRKIGVIK